MNRKIAIFTVIETVGLVAWIALVRAGRTVLGPVIVVIGFVAEHIVSFNVKNGRPLLSRVPWGPVLTVSGLESVAWLLWKFLLPEQFSLGQSLLAAGVLGILIELGHALELNVVNGFPLLYRFGQRLRDSIDITLIETIGGAVTLTIILHYGLFTVQGIPTAIALGIILQDEHKRSARKVVT